jgi:Fe-S-cluster containining protein
MKREDLYNPEILKKIAKDKKQENKAYFAKLKKRKPANLDDIVHDLHYEAFEEIDCLQCANCCKSISPIITYKDIERIAKHLRQKPSAVIDQYFVIDEDDDYVFKETPCPFLMDDNMCMIYESRPKACKEYPHTDRRRFHQILNITLKNIEVCPVVYKVVEGIKQSKKL